MHDLRGNFFSQWKKMGRKRRREKGGVAPGRRGSEAESTYRKDGKPKDGDWKDGKGQQEEKSSERKIHKGSAGHVPGGVNEGVAKGMGKGCKRGGGTGLETRMQLDRGRTQGKHGRRNGSHT